MSAKTAKRRKRYRITSPSGDTCPKRQRPTPASARSWPEGITFHHACNKCKIRTLSYATIPLVYEWVRMQRP